MMQGLSFEYFCDHDERIDLQFILQWIEDGSVCQWRILHFDGIGKVDLTDSRVVSLKQKVDASTNGLMINWEDLFALSDWAGQIIWCSILGHKPRLLPYQYADNQSLDNLEADFFIKKIDGWYWEVFSSDQNFLRRLKQCIKNSEWIESSKYT